MMIALGRSRSCLHTHTHTVAIRKLFWFFVCLHFNGELDEPAQIPARNDISDGNDGQIKLNGAKSVCTVETIKHKRNRWLVDAHMNVCSFFLCPIFGFFFCEEKWFCKSTRFQVNQISSIWNTFWHNSMKFTRNRMRQSSNEIGEKNSNWIKNLFRNTT